MKKLMLIALSLTPVSVLAASPQAFNFHCGNGSGAYSDGKGGVWLNQQPAKVKQFNDNYWEATQGKVVLSITKADDGNPQISFTGPGRTHGICQPEDNRSFAPASAKTAPSTQGPSFSCAAVRPGSMEEVICHSPELSALDRQMASTWKAALDKSGGDKTLKASQRGWVKGRDECWKESDHAACLKTAYQQRIGELQKTWSVK